MSKWADSQGRGPAYSGLSLRWAGLGSP
ncbi:uncharacterized protein G2W53_040717 [Senna tora]|uniref:Uncharacterized protein n=1 Tax=Senna tora TaxID=362788 RepID=A0A834W0R3_9FABA|nr:uncharacterized protein G2W53_040717 [Senna tora]